MVTPLNKLLQPLIQQLQATQQQQQQQQQQLSPPWRGVGGSPAKPLSQEAETQTGSVSISVSTESEVTTPPRQNLFMAAMASAGTQTSPIRPIAPRGFQSPTKSSINIANVAGLLSGANLSPGQITVGQLLSPVRSQAGIHHLSSPIPSIAIQSSPTKTPVGGSFSQPSTPSTLTASQGTPPAPKRQGSLALFYRKVYQLGYIRIKDLCDRLSLPAEHMQK